MVRCFPLVVALAVVGCQTGLRGEYERDPGVSLETLSSWAWQSDEPFFGVAAAPDADPRLTPDLDRRVRAELARQLAAKGWRQSGDPRAADLLVSFSVSAREEADVDTYPVGGYGGTPGGGGWYTTTEVRTYTRGTLSITFTTEGGDRRVWHGWTSKRLYASDDPSVREANLREAIAAILVHFPAPARAP